MVARCYQVQQLVLMDDTVSVDKGERGGDETGGAEGRVCGQREIFSPPLLRRRLFI